MNIRILVHAPSHTSDWTEIAVIDPEIGTVRQFRIGDGMFEEVPTSEYATLIEQTDDTTEPAPPYWVEIPL